MRGTIMNARKFTSLALAAALTAGLAGTAMAKPSDEAKEATALQTAKVSLTQAITTAEQQTGGKAYDAGVDIKGGVPRIAVETNGPKGVQTVVVDAQSGKVVSTTQGGETD